jgi:hypothetical protein
MLADPDVKTDEQIHQAANEEWLGVLSQLWIAFDKPLDPERLALYRNMFGDLPLGLLEQAVKRAIREHKFNSIPTVADVWSAVRKELNNPADLDRAIKLWIESRWSAAVHVFEKTGA